MTTSYTMKFVADTMAGERGHWWRIVIDNTVRAQGWSRGRLRHAEDDAEEALAKIKCTPRKVIDVEAMWTPS